MIQVYARDTRVNIYTYIETLIYIYIQGAPDIISLPVLLDDGVELTPDTQRVFTLVNLHREIRVYILICIRRGCCTAI